VSVLRAQLRAVGAAFAFLTRLPLGPLASHDPADLPASVVYFPVVGLVVAAFGGVAFAVAAHFWSVPIALLFSMIATVLATGAFHEDALADALDGFGGGWSRDQVLTIMKDSRVGSYALVGVILVLALKFAALSSIAANPAAIERIVRALIAGHTLGRWSSVPLIRAYAYVRPTAEGERPSAGRPFVSGVSVARLTVATVIALAIVVAALEGRAVGPIAVTLVLTFLAGKYFRQRIGGITGDALGAANQLVEVGVYLVLAAPVS
jgi:adenosylcobinamide-GDP ribazoletransferase